MTAPAPLLSRFNVTFDKNLELHSKAAAAISTATTTLGDAGILDLGDAVWFGLWVVDVQSIVVTATAAYTLSLLGSNSATFASGTGLYTRELAVLRIGDTASFKEDVDSKIGRYKMPVWNVKVDEYCRYVRLSVLTAGTANFDFNSYLGSMTQSF